MEKKTKKVVFFFYLICNEGGVKQKKQQDFYNSKYANKYEDCENKMQNYRRNNTIDGF